MSRQSWLGHQLDKTIKRAEERAVADGSGLICIGCDPPKGPTVTKAPTAITPADQRVLRAHYVYLLAKANYDAVTVIARLHADALLAPKAIAAVHRGRGGEPVLTQQATVERPAGLVLDGRYFAGGTRLRVVSRPDGYAQNDDSMARQLDRGVRPSAPTPCRVVQYETSAGWRGFAFLKVPVGADAGRSTYALWRRLEGRTDLKRALAALVLDPEAAARAWMDETTRCSVCGTPLTAEDSIARGMGLVCAAKSY